MAAHGVRGLLLINGGAAVALLAFLQAIWQQPDTRSLALCVVLGMIPLVLGVAVGVAIHFARFEASLAWSEPDGRGRRLAHWQPRLARISIGCFLAGMSIVIAGALWNLP